MKRHRTKVVASAAGAGVKEILGEGSTSTPPWSRVLGMMSGTSLDGVDGVVTAFDGDGEWPRWVRTWSRPYPRGLAARLRSCAKGELGSWEVARLHHDLGRWYAESAADALHGEPVDAVGLHGQTVFHAPEGRGRATLQLGEPAYLVERFRVPVVSQFRTADLAAGGQGAPLATLFHQRVWGRPGAMVCVHNLGGISNVTVLDGRDPHQARVQAFDTGPANLLLDGAVRLWTEGLRSLDRDGRWAAAGRADAGCVERWLRHPYFRRKPPKSTGRELFGDAFLERCWEDMEGVKVRRLEDRLATLGEFTARSIVDAYVRHVQGVPAEVVWCGGGALNPWLVGRLNALLGEAFPGVRCVDTRDRGWPVKAVEGGAFALLARERLLGRPGNLPEATGAGRAALCGQVSLP